MLLVLLIQFPVDPGWPRLTTSTSCSPTVHWSSLLGMMKSILQGLSGDHPIDLHGAFQRAFFGTLMGLWWDFNGCYARSNYPLTVQFYRFSTYLLPRVARVQARKFASFTKLLTHRLFLVQMLDAFVGLLRLVRAGYNCDSWLFRHTWCFIGWTWLNIFWTSWEVGNEGEMKVKWRWQCFTCFTSWVSSFTESKGASICHRRRSAARPRCRPKCFNHHMDVEHVVFPKKSPGIWVEQW